MLQIQLPHFVKGKLHIECSGSKLPDWINQAVAEGILLEDIYWVDEHKVRLTILLADFFRLAKLKRIHRIRTRIVKKVGVPFYIVQARKRKFFFLGILLFFALLIAMTSFVWSVQIEGAEQIPVEHIQQILTKDGVYAGQLKMRLPERSSLQHRLLKQIPQATWIGFRLEGTRVIVTIVEKKQVDSKDRQKSDPIVNFVASKNAMVTDIQIERGNPLIDVNDVVKKGQLIVSGTYGDPMQPGVGRTVGAKGKVMGEVWYDSEITVDLTQQREVYTGLREKRSLLYIGNWILRNPFAEAPYAHYEQLQLFKPLQVGTWKLPVGMLQEELLEMRLVEHRLSIPEAVQLGVDRARVELLQETGSDGQILEQKILHQRVENGKVYLNVHFVAIENIAVPQLIMPGG